LWPDASRRSEEIRKISDIFRNQGYVQTSSLMNSIAQDVESNEFLEIDKKYLEIMRPFCQEYCNQDNKLTTLFNFIMTAILFPITQDRARLADKFNELNPWLGQYKERVLLLSDLSKYLLTQKSPDDKAIFLITIMLYGWIVEGLFKEAIRLIYLFVNMSAGKDIKYFDVQEIELKQLRKGLEELTESASEILFSGYEDAHLRNSIHHFRFRYDDGTKRIRFRDYDYRKKEFTYDKVFSLSEFNIFYRLLAAVDDLIMLDILILRIGDLVYAAKPFEA